MKILILSNVYPTKDMPYAGSFIHRQVKALKTLADRNLEVIVLHLDMRSARKKRRYGFYKNIIDDVNVYTCSVPCGPIPNILEIVYEKSAVFSLKKIMEIEGTIDVIHAHFTIMGCCAAVIKEKFHIPIVLTEHSSALIEQSAEKSTIRQCKRAYKSADKLVAVGSNLAKHMRAFTEKEILIIPNVLPQMFKEGDICKGENREFRFISVVGMATKDKKLDLLLQAFYDLSFKYSNICLWVVGEGSIIESLKKECAPMKCNKRIRFLGTVNNEKLPDVYRKCNCFVLPSVKETFGMVYIEAAGCGLPIIGCHSGGTDDIIVKENGLLAKNNDLRSLEKAMEHVVTHFYEFDSKQISADVHRRFGEKSISERLVRLYETVRTG